MKKFNTVGRCIPKIHYMVNIDDKYEQLSGYLDTPGVETGYLLSFCTNKKPVYKEQIIKYNGHEIYEVVVTYANK